MTEQNVPPQDSPALHPLNSQGEDGQIPQDSEPDLLTESEPDWEPVPFPGTLPVAEWLQMPTLVPAESTPAPVQGSDFNRREAELLQLIQDLNQCNDALLHRVGDLEEALERAEAALQVEVERSHQSQSITSAEAQAAIAQQQHQVAQLLSELDIANDAVRRTTIHNDTLQANLDTTKQRVAQLERECTLLQQRFTEKSNALSQAEATCRDLRSRLQRQQHYTLQFKAALEKCLDVSSHRSAPLPQEPAPVAPELPLRPHPLAMPKAQQIKPWSSDEAASRPDPSLGNLLRNLKSVGQGPSPAEPTFSLQPPVSAPVTPAALPDPEAENCLWQDLERVIETSVATPEPVAPVLPPELESSSSVSAPTASSPSDLLPEEPPELTFTEPSPWGAPITPPPVAPSGKAEAAAVEARPLIPPPLAQELPAVPDLPLPTPVAPSPLESRGGAATLPPLLSTPAMAQSPSPVVYPLRPQKKLKSIAAVQLPSFPRKQRSQ